MSHDNNDLGEKFGVANPELIYCPHCKLPGTYFSKDEEYSWAVLLVCSQCDAGVTWSVCCECSNLRNRITTRRHAQRHHRTKHSAATTTKTKRLKLSSSAISDSIRATATIDNDNDIAVSMHDVDDDVDLTNMLSPNVTDKAVSPPLIRAASEGFLPLSPPKPRPSCSRPRRS